MKLEKEIKTDKFGSQFQRASLSVIFTGVWLTDKFNAILKPYGISEQQYNVLRILKGQKGTPINLYSIQERMLHRMSNATRLVEKLRLKEYVKRETCENNRRKVEITLTEKGQELLVKIEKNIQSDGYLQELLTKWTDEEAKQVGDLLDKLRE